MADQYEPNWESLTSYEIPDWVNDSKFGIYAHWGPYSAAAFGNEWYARNMYIEGSPEHAHFVSRFGDLSKVGYKEWIPRFTAENFDPEQWAEIIAGSGAQYAGISLVHHDGFLLWDCKVNRWNAANMGPKRDLYGDLVAELRKKGLRILATFHHMRTFNWYLPGSSTLGEAPSESEIEQAKSKGWDLFDPEYADLYWNAVTGKYEDFLEEWKKKIIEVFDNYQPDLTWFDGGRFREGPAQDAVCTVLAHYFNRSLKWGKGVTVLNKLPTNGKFNFPRELGMLTFEQGRDRLPGIERPWIDDINIAERSWGYIEGQTYRSAAYILKSLIDAVSRGGGIFLSLAPMADGTIPDGQVKVLGEIGEWLSVNSEAIHGTRPWRIQTEGNVERIWEQGKRWRYHLCDETDIRFTCTKDALYAIVMGCPKGDTYHIGTLRPITRIGDGDIRSVRLLGCGQPLTWNQNNDGLLIDLPNERPNDQAYTFKIEIDGEIDLEM